MSKNRRSSFECQRMIDKIGKKKSGAEKLAWSYVESRFDTDYLDSIHHLWLIESYVAGYQLAKSENYLICESKA